MQQAVLAALLVLTWLVLRLLEANALATTRKLIAWLLLGSGISALLAVSVDTNSLVGPPLAAGLMLLWAAPAISLLTFRSQRLMTRLEHALNRGDLEAAERLLEKAAVAVNASSAVDLEWNRIQLCRLEGRLRVAQNRLGDALPPLQESYLRARELGVPLYINESGNKLLECYRALDLTGDAEALSAQLGVRSRRWPRLTLASQARRALDSAASVPAAPADTTSPRSL